MKWGSLTQTGHTQPLAQAGRAPGYRGALLGLSITLEPLAWTPWKASVGLGAAGNSSPPLPALHRGSGGRSLSDLSRNTAFGCRRGETQPMTQPHTSRRMDGGRGRVCSAAPEDPRAGVKAGTCLWSSSFSQAC